MSILQNDLPGATVVDLFCGSGALGLEALSRGALHATFVDSAAASLASLRANIEQLALLTRRRSIAWTRSDFSPAWGSNAYDAPLAAPPYRKGLAAQVAERWRDGQFSRILAIEHATDEAVPAGGDTRRYGDTALTFYRA
jgi:N6-adenine-specific methylase